MSQQKKLAFYENPFSELNDLPNYSASFQDLNFDQGRFKMRNIDDNSATDKEVAINGEF